MFSFTTQRTAIELIAKLRPADLRRALPALNQNAAELLLKHLSAAAQTITSVAEDERVVRMIQHKQQP